jgi:hypothetical protein
MINLSTGGVSVLVRRQHLRRASYNERFFLTFALPETEGEFCMVGSVRHTQTIDVSGSLRVGFAFHPWGGRDLNADQRSISRFITQHERRLLRRRR